jgi:ABC-type cobalamin/Fe3+-siderophores transport system ATPase subunit
MAQSSPSSPDAPPGDLLRVVTRRDGGTCASGEVITTGGLGKTFPGDIHAVVDLELHVRAGEIFGLLGPNGAGKTTTVGMLSTRVVPTAGTACVGGVDVVRHPALAKQMIEEVGKEMGVLGVTVDENVAKVSVVGAGMYGSPGIAAAMFGALAGAGVNIEVISTSEISISCLIQADKVKEAVAAIHARFFPDGSNGD